MAMTSDIYKSVVPLDGKPRIFRRGGARNRKGKVSRFLTKAQVSCLAQAIFSAAQLGLPLNRFITIHWERAGVHEAKSAWATAQFLKYVRDWVAKKGLPFAYVWIRENDYGDGSKGDHVHILAHIPKGQSIGRLQLRWIKRITGRTYRKGVIKTARVGGTANASIASPEHYNVNLLYVAEYVLKGGSKAISEALALGRWGDGGRIVGKRCGISRNLSRQLHARRQSRSSAFRPDLMTVSGSRH